MKSSTYYFDIKTKTLADFEVCISVPLIEDKLKLFPSETLLLGAFSLDSKL